VNGIRDAHVHSLPHAERSAEHGSFSAELNSRSAELDLFSAETRQTKRTFLFCGVVNK
jgi:hypothetical protein